MSAFINTVSIHAIAQQIHYLAAINKYVVACDSIKEALRLDFEDLAEVMESAHASNLSNISSDAIKLTNEPSNKLQQQILELFHCDELILRNLDGGYAVEFGDSVITAGSLESIIEQLEQVNIPNALVRPSDDDEPQAKKHCAIEQGWLDDYTTTHPIVEHDDLSVLSEVPDSCQHYLDVPHMHMLTDPIVID